MRGETLVWNVSRPKPFVAPERSEPVLECDGAVVKCLVLGPGQQAPVHVHRVSVDVMVIVKGSGLATIDGEERRVTAGDIILNPTGTRHGIRNDGDEDLVWVVVQSPPPNRALARSATT